MFSAKHLLNSTLFLGPENITKCFIFETAMLWAEEGYEVFYITPAPLTGFPAKYHDRGAPLPESFQMIKFLYLSNYTDLIQQIVSLHTFMNAPRILLIDNLENYINAETAGQHIHSKIQLMAKLFAALHDTMHACSRMRKTQVRLCASLQSTGLKKNFYHLYFHDIWIIKATENNNETDIQLKQLISDGENENNQIFHYRKFQDGALILSKIFGKKSQVKNA